MRPLPVGARPPTPPMSEAALMSKVRRQARTWGWLAYHTHRSDRSDKGWPDLVLAHPVRKRLLIVELKTATGKVTPEQQTWLDLLTACGIDARVWRPADLDNGEIERALFPLARAGARQ